METTFTAIIIILCLSALLLSVYSLVFNKEKCHKLILLISLVLSIVAIFCSTRNSFTISDAAAFVAIVVGIVVLPTTIVIGWNIYQLIDVKQLRDELEKLKITKEEIHKEIEMEKESILRSYFIDQMALIPLVRQYNNMTEEPERLFVSSLNLFHSKIYVKGSVTNILSYEYAHQLLSVLAECKDTFDIDDFANKVKKEGLDKDTFQFFMNEYRKQPHNEQVDIILRRIGNTINN